jgi:uncharacterized protein with ParB-like and HNH nuclease domain
MIASETKIQAIIEGTKQYVVPLFQRRYSWDKKEWQVLWSDITDLCEETSNRSHFIGSIVTMPTKSVPEGVAKYLLIDGQQRLTTIFILLAVLRDKSRKNNQEKLADQITNTALVNPYENEDEPDYYKLLPTQGDRAFFQDIMCARTLPEQSRFGQAYQFFERKFRQSTLDVHTLRKVIFSNLSVVSIVLGLEDDPHLVFESLNAKGMPLTQADLIRNYFFMKIHVGKQEAIHKQYWQPMQDALKENLTEFIRHYLMRQGQVIRHGDIYFRLKDLVSNGDALVYLQDLARFAVFYQKLLFPTNETDGAIRRALERLNRIEVTTAYPLLLNLYDDYDKGILSSQDFVSMLRIIENFMIRRFACNVPTNQLNKIFPPLYAQLQARSSGSPVERLQSVLQSKGYPKNAEFTSRLIDAKLYGGGDRAIKTKLILESFEESHQHKEQVEFAKLSIEHIMPQTLTEEWQMSLDTDWETTHELLLHTIGNLTLTAYNPELSNDTFEKKRQRLRDSHLELNKSFANKQSWKREDIEKRSAELAELALTIWPYFGDGSSEREDMQKVTGTTPHALYILGQHFKVKSWRDVLEQTMKTIADLEPEKFQEIITHYPRFVGRSRQKFRTAREIGNDLFIETNLSSNDIMRFCYQSLETIALTSNDWQVEIS